MRIFVMGGTGTIGAAIVRELVGRGHEVLALARSQTSAAALQSHGASVLAGDIRRPDDWLSELPAVDGVIHAASDFADDMGAVDTLLLDRLLPVLGKMQRPRLIYTGGCWLYGATGGVAVTEAAPFDPLPAFSWMVPNLRRVLCSADVVGLVVHPAMVYDRKGGVLASFIEDARTGGPVTIVGGAHVRWPLVHADDLARLYALALEGGQQGQSYNAASVPSMRVSDLASAIARRLGSPGCLLRTISADDAAASLGGEWARGYAVDQSMSSEKARRELGWQWNHVDPIESLFGAPSE